MPIISNQENHLIEILNSISELVFILDETGYIIFTNSIIKTQLGYTEEDLIGKKFTEFVYIKSKERANQILEEIIRAKERFFSLPIRSRDNTKIFIDMYIFRGRKKDPNNVICIGKIISPEKRELDIIGESDKKFKRMAENINEGLTIIEDGKIVYLNNRVCEIFGYPKNELENLTGIELAVKEEKERLRKIQKEVDAKTREIESLRFWIRQKDGTKRYIQNKYSYSRTIDNKRDVYVLTSDITERKQIEDSLKESEIKYRMLFEGANDGIIIMNLNMFLECNERAVEIYGCSNKNEIIGYPPWKFSPQIQLDGQNSKEKALNYLKNALNGEKQRFYWLHTKKDGTKFDAEISLSKIEFNDKMLIQAIVRDVTEQKLIQEKLRLNEKFLQSVFNAIRDCIYILDPNYNLIRVNAGFKELFEITENIQGNKCYNVIQNRDSPCPWCPIIIKKDMGKGGGNIVPLIKKNNQVGWLDLSIFPLKDNIGNTINMIGHLKDITKRVNAQFNLKESEVKYRYAYQRAEFYKDLFAHDINNIFQNILSANELNEIFLRNSKVSHDILQNFKLIEDQISRGSNLVSNVRKLSKLEKQTFENLKKNILTPLRIVIEEIKRRFSSHEINIKLNPYKNEIFAYTNEYLYDVYQNILENAIIHNKNDFIDIQIKVSKIEKIDTHYVEVIFLDNGRGVKDEIKEKIFRRGYDEDGKIGGTGLGLTLIEKIVESFRGKISVEDRVKGDYSQGSKFILLIPQNPF
jgi:PAS domain S-box-containing protein